MPVNKNANLRYRILDECLGNRTRHYTNDELLEALNDKIAEHGFSPIGRTQYYKDLNFMKSEAGWSIELETYRYGKKVRLRYADPDFSIKNSPLNNNEKEEFIHSFLAPLTLLGFNFVSSPPLITNCL